MLEPKGRGARDWEAEKRGDIYFCKLCLFLRSFLPFLVQKARCGGMLRYIPMYILGCSQHNRKVLIRGCIGLSKVNSYCHRSSPKDGKKAIEEESGAC